MGWHGLPACASDLVPPKEDGLSETAYSDRCKLDLVGAVADRVIVCTADRTWF